MTALPRFSVVMPTYNRSDLLRSSLQSMLAQTWTDFEAIIVDDGSTDDTLTVLEREFGSCPQLRVLRSERRGPGGARNVGATAATGQFLTFFDSDDLWTPWTLATVAAVQEQHGAEALIYLRPSVFDTEPKMEAHQYGPIEARVYRDVLEPQGKIYLGANALAAIPRPVFFEAGGFAEGRHNMEDVDLALKVGPRCRYIEIHSPVCLAYRKHAFQLTKQAELFYRSTKLLLGHELAGRYPGGASTQPARERLIAYHARGTCRRLSRIGMAASAIELFILSLPLNWRLRRWTFLGGFPLEFLRHRVLPRPRTGRSGP